MHALEKILAAHAGLSEVTTGQIVTCRVDTAGVNDLYLQVLRSFEEMGGEKVWNPDRVVFFLDHYVPAPTIGAAENHKEMREFCRKQGIKNLFDIDAGVCHQILAEKGFSRPGELIVVTDSHTTTHGVFGAFGTGVGATDLATILISGEIWLRVPPVIKIVFDGRLKPYVSAKDMVLYALGKLGADIATYKAVEYAGEAVDRCSVSERMVLGNMAVEMGAKTSYIQPNQEVLDYVRSRTQKPFTVYTTDPDYKYEAEYHFDVSDLEPVVAAPSSVDNLREVAEVEGTHVDQVFVGSCTGGRLEDLRIVARVLKNKRIAEGTRLIFSPATREILAEGLREGIVQDLLTAGAVMIPPGCGPCLGTHQGLLAPGEVAITTTNRNFPGRMGSPKAQIYLASPLTCAVAALTGHITHPGRYVEADCCDGCGNSHS
ncbi:MAG TPA: 3-isopropylmalate dehydratase large subunit [Firmicutes bacterium]|nr:3-isopropylmalate dehydratase large subunit [Candidatus Fermentithermobacillaceae bacterium]